MITFLLNDQVVTVSQAESDLTVLQYLREHKGLTGSKEGCASGDCGACTVVVAQLNEDNTALLYRALNSCITFMSALEGKQLISVEHIGSPSQPHPVQQAMVDHHGSQCGFCTPGFVMSMFALYHDSSSANRDDVVHALSGNLCRCTGYRPIIDAALDACNQEREDKFISQQQSTIATLMSLQSQQQAGHNTLKIPKDRKQLEEAMNTWPDAKLVAGSTDLALHSTQAFQPLDRLISLTHVRELHRIEDTDKALVIGSACTFSALQPTLLAYFPELTELVTRFASLPIRNQATLGGNIANASPIGDMPPVLLALNAKLVLDNGQSQRTVPVRDFFVGYKQTQLAKGEWLDSIVINKPQAHTNTHTSQLSAYKVSKRNEDDISAVCAVFNLSTEHGRVTSLLTGFGGVAATPVYCSELEQALIGKDWTSKANFESGRDMLADAFSPIDDVRASAQYRKQMVVNLWHRFWLESQRQQHPIETRVVCHA